MSDTRSKRITSPFSTSFSLTSIQFEWGSPKLNTIGITQSGHFIIMLTLRLCFGVTTRRAEELVNPIGDRFNKIGITAAESLKQRGYAAEDHYCTTSDVYRLCLTRGRNPLFRYGSLLAMQSSTTESSPYFATEFYRQVWLSNSASV